MNMQLIAKPFKYCMLFALMLFIGIGCDSFLDVNEDPNTTTEAPGDFLFTEALTVLQSNRNIEVGPDMAFFAQTYASNASAGVFLSPDRYQIGPSAFGVTNNFGGIYTNVLNNLELFVNDAQEADNPRNNAIAQSRIVQSYTFYYLTVLFGDVPFTEALNPDIQNPVFDEQPAILDGLVDRIDSAIGMIDLEDQSDAIANEDIIYKGNMQQWLQFANSLKLRILMLQYNTDPSIASEIQELIDNPNLIRTNADNAEFPYADAPGNENQQFQLYADFAGGQPSLENQGFLYGSDSNINIMTQLNDPRLSTYFLEAPTFDDAGNVTGTQGFIGARNGANDGDERSALSSNIIRPAFPGRIITASETLLHEAEFLATQGQMGTARNKLDAGIRASMDYFDSMPGEISEDAKDTYVSSILEDFDAGNDGVEDEGEIGNSEESAVRVIQLQHFIDVFEKSPENWTLWRRTKVPLLELPTSAQLGTIIRRFPISAEEVSANTNSPQEQVPLGTPMSFENDAN